METTPNISPSIIVDTRTGLEYDPISHQVRDVDGEYVGHIYERRFTPRDHEPIHIDTLRAVCRLIELAEKPEILGTVADGNAAAPVADLEPLFATADPQCRTETPPPGDWTEGGKYRAVTAEERGQRNRPKGAEYWSDLGECWELVDDKPHPLYATCLYRVPAKNGGAS